MMEPDFLMQTGEIEHLSNPPAWFAEATMGAQDKGATYHRYSYNPARRLLLCESWLVQPADCGAPRFQLTYAEEKVE